MNEIVSIDFDSLNLASISPMLIAIIGALSILISDLFNKTKDRSLYIILVALFLVFDLFTLLAYGGDKRGMFDLILLDGISILSQSIILCASILFILLGFSKLRFQDYRYAEYFALYLFVVAGFQFMVSSDSLIVIFVALETSSLALYTMIAMHNRMKSIEAAIKYFTMGALSGAFFVFGAMLFYLLTSSLQLGEISYILAQENFFDKNNFSNYILLLTAFVFMFASLAFKLSLFPFHTWVADVYQGSTSVMAGFLSIVPKMAAFIVALRFFEMFIHSNDAIVYWMLYGTVVLTMSIPNIIALQQTDVKRMLAYSSVSNAGMAMAAILIGTSQGTNALFLYWVLFTITNFGAFSMLWLNRKKDLTNPASTYNLDKFSGLVQICPFTASIFALFLFALIGLPPFALFWGKMYLVSSAVNAGEVALAIIIVLNSVIAAFYYLKPVAYMFLKDPVTNNNVDFLQNATKAMKAMIGFAVFLTLCSMFFIESLLNIISSFVLSSGF